MADQDKIKKRLEEIVKRPENRFCADCSTREPRWASVNLGVFMCLQCSGIHRNLGVHISFVRSVNLDTWKAEQVKGMEAMGNANAKAIYEADVPPGYPIPGEHASTRERERWIRDKYEHKKFMGAVRTVQATGSGAGAASTKSTSRRTSDGGGSDPERDSSRRTASREASSSDRGAKARSVDRRAEGGEGSSRVKKTVGPLKKPGAAAPAPAPAAAPVDLLDFSAPPTTTPAPAPPVQQQQPPQGQGVDPGYANALSNQMAGMAFEPFQSAPPQMGGQQQQQMMPQPPQQQQGHGQGLLEFGVALANPPPAPTAQQQQPQRQQVGADSILSMYQQGNPRGSPQPGMGSMGMSGGGGMMYMQNMGPQMGMGGMVTPPMGGQMSPPMGHMQMGQMSPMGQAGGMGGFPGQGGQQHMGMGRGGNMMGGMQGGMMQQQQQPQQQQQFYQQQQQGMGAGMQYQMAPSPPSGTVPNAMQGGLYAGQGMGQGIQQQGFPGGFASSNFQGMQQPQMGGNMNMMNGGMTGPGQAGVPPRGWNANGVYM